MKNPAAETAASSIIQYFFVVMPASEARLPAGRHGAGMTAFYEIVNVKRYLKLARVYKMVSRQNKAYA